MTNAEDFFLKHCMKKVTNRLWATNPDGKRQLYRHPDLDDLSQEAFNAGERYFYYKPADPSNPHGHLIKADPEYVYECALQLTPAEYESLMEQAQAEKANN